VSCPVVTIKSTGVAALSITSGEVTGANSDDFTADAPECSGSVQPSLVAPGQSCTVKVQFQPSAPGQRDATLVVHQNLPPPDHGTPLQLVGTGTESPPVGHTLTVTVDASAAAAGVTSNPPGIDCPSTCTSTFDDGTDIMLTVTYDQGSSQVSWDGCDSTNGDTCTIQLTADTRVTAHLYPIVA
jgi:hypothetical protein